jgi:hypothetical protein
MAVFLELERRLCMVVHACNPTYLRNRNRMPAQERGREIAGPYFKEQTKVEYAYDPSYVGGIGKRITH